MSNSNRGEVNIRLDKTRKLRFDFNALAEFEDLMGCSMIAAFQDFRDSRSGAPGVSFKMVRAMLWAGLLHEDPKLTPREAGELLEQTDGDEMLDKMSYAITQIVSAFSDRLGDKEAKKKIQELQQYHDEQTGENSSE